MKINWIVFGILLLGSMAFAASNLPLCNPPAGKIVHAVYPGTVSGEENDITLVETQQYVSLAGKNVGWVMFSDNWFQGRAFPTSTATWIRNYGSVPYIRLMLRDTTNTGCGTASSYTLDKINTGVLDSDLHAWFASAASFSTPIFVEWGTEMNGNWFPWSGKCNGANAAGVTKFKQAYQHIIDIARAEGATNVHFAFHLDGYDTPDQAWNHFENYYPGDSYIDVVGISIYGPQEPCNSESYESYTQMMDNMYSRMAAMTTKPLMIIETGAVLNGEPNFDPTTWMSAGIDSLLSGRYPRIKAFSYWNENWENNNQASCDSIVRLQSIPSMAAMFNQKIGQNSVFIPSFTFSANCSAPPPNQTQLSISTTSLPSGKEGTAYSYTLQATGGTTPYAWSISGLPSGLTYTASTGAITGTPAAGTNLNSPYTVIITATDSTTPTHQTATKQLSLAINSSAPALAITTTSLPSGKEGVWFSYTLQATGGTTPYTWSMSGLPSGLGYSTSTGAITGTPAAGSSSSSPYTVSITVTDSTTPTHKTATKQLSLVINASSPTLAISTTSLPSGKEGVWFSYTVQATGGITPYVWSMSGLPSGLGYSTSTGAITGTPSAGCSSSSPYSVSITVTDSTTPTHKTATKQLSLAINSSAPALAITTTSLPSGKEGVWYNYTVQATGGITPYVWSMSGLPSGLGYSTSTGAITGTPAAGSSSSSPYSVSITVTDSTTPTHKTATKQLQLAVSAAPPPGNNSTFFDDFSTYGSLQGKCLVDGKQFSPWKVVYASYGCVKLDGSSLRETPKAASRKAQTYSVMVTGPTFNGPLTYEVDVRTDSQLRTGSTPKNWEVAWVVWHHSNDKHFYYLILKPGVGESEGWELGKEDPAYPGNQRYLATGSSPVFPIGGTYHVKITQDSSNTIRAYANGQLLTTFTDTERPYTSGHIALYSEDSDAVYSNVKVTTSTTLSAGITGSTTFASGAAAISTSALVDQNAYANLMNILGVYVETYKK